MHSTKAHRIATLLAATAAIMPPNLAAAMNSGLSLKAYRKPRKPNPGALRQPHHTKSGPGRRHKQGDGTHNHLSLKQRTAGGYGRGLQNWLATRPSKGRV